MVPNKPRFHNRKGCPTGFKNPNDWAVDSPTIPCVPMPVTHSEPCHLRDPTPPSGPRSTLLPFSGSLVASAVRSPAASFVGLRGLSSGLLGYLNLFPQTQNLLTSKKVTTQILHESFPNLFTVLIANYGRQGGYVLLCETRTRSLTCLQVGQEHHPNMCLLLRSHRKMDVPT